METYPLTIRPRCDTEDEWIKYNPVLKYKEFVVSVDKMVQDIKLEMEHLSMINCNLYHWK